MFINQNKHIIIQTFSLNRNLKLTIASTTTKDNSTNYIIIVQLSALWFIERVGLHNINFSQRKLVNIIMTYFNIFSFTWYDYYKTVYIVL